MDSNGSLGPSALGSHSLRQVPTGFAAPVDEPVEQEVELTLYFTNSDATGLAPENVQ